MYNTKDSFCFDTSTLNDTRQTNALKNLKYFADHNAKHEKSVINKSNFSGVFPSQSTVNSRMNQLFKVPSVDNFPVKKANIKNIKNPTGGVQTRRVRNDLKASQQSKLSLIPRPSFINSRKSMQFSRSNQLNARKELIKKMVFLAECALKEKEQIKPSTPVRLAGLTPKKTPRSGGYFILPEFSKRVPKLEEIKSPIEDFIRKEMFSYSTKSGQEKTPHKTCENTNCESAVANKENVTRLQPETRKKFNQVLSQCKIYSNKVTSIYESLKILDEGFESRLNEIPEYKVYNEFCKYQSKKEDLYRDLKMIEDEFRNSITTKMNVSNKLKSFTKKREDLFLKQISLLKEFQYVVETTLGKCDDVEIKTKKIEEQINEGTPKLRRSLRLSRISKKDEKTPLTKKLKKLDAKSRGIQKSGRY